MAVRYSTTSAKTFEKKNHRGASFKTVDKRNEKDSGGDHELHKTAARIKPGKLGIGLAKGHGPEAFMEKNHRRASFKTIAPRADTEGGEDPRLVRATNRAVRAKRLDSWARGGRKTP